MMSISHKAPLHESSVFEVKGGEETAEPQGIVWPMLRYPLTTFQPHYLKRICFSKES